MYKGWSLDCTIVGSFFGELCAAEYPILLRALPFIHTLLISNFDIFLFSTLIIVASLQALWVCLETWIVLR